MTCLPCSQAAAAALCSGLTSAKQLPAFRATHQVATKKGDTSKPGPTLPSDKNAKHTYGTRATPTFEYSTAQLLYTVSSDLAVLFHGFESMVEVMGSLQYPPC